MKSKSSNGRSHGSHGLDDKEQYILQYAPTILAALVIRRASTSVEDLVENAISGTSKLYDMVHEIDSPVSTMLSQPVDQKSG